MSWGSSVATQVWAWQDGTPTDDGLNAVAMGPDGTSVWAGYSNGNTTTADTTGTLWVAVKLDAHGTVLWKWENGTAECGDNRINAAVMCQDGSVVLAGVGGDDFHVIKLDDGGGLLWHFQDGSGDEDIAGGIAMGEDDSVVVAGTVSGDWDIPNLGSTDMAAFKLDVNGTLLWKWQDGTVGNDLANAVAMAEDGSVVIAGHSRGDLLGRSAAEDDDSSTLFPQWLGGDFAAVKLDSSGTELWRWQDGGSGFDQLDAVAMAEDGSCVLAGYSTGDWDGEYNVGGNDFAAVKLNANGDEIWRWQDGTVDDDFVQAIEFQADGNILLGGHTEGDWSALSAGGRDFALVKLNRHGDEMWRWQGGSADTGGTLLDDELHAMASGADGRVVLAGRTYGSWGKTNLGEGDFMGLMLDTSAFSTASPTATPSSAPAFKPVQPNFKPVTTDDDDYFGADDDSGSSDTTAVVAGVLSALAAVALLAMGVLLRKRHIKKRDATARTQTSLPVVDVDEGGGNDPPPYQPNWQPPPPQQERGLPSAIAPAAAAVAAAAAGGAAGDYDGESGGISPPFPPAFAGVLQHSAETTAHAGRHGVGGGGGGGGGGGTSGDSGDVSPVEGGVVPSARDSENAIGGSGGGTIGGYSLEKGSTKPSAQARKGSDGGVGGGGSLAKGNTSPVSTTGQRGGGGVGVSTASTAGAVFEQGGGKDVEADPALTVTTSTANISTGERDEFTSAYRGASGPAAGLASVADEAESTLHETGGSSSTARRRPSSGPGLGRAVGEAALELARSSQIPGVSEAAMAVSILVNLLMDNQDSKKSTEGSMRRCRSIISMLERASRVLGKGGETTGKAERDMIEDVLDAIFDLVELVKTYQSKNKLAQLMTSTLFRRRQDEMGAVVDRAVLGLQLGLHVRVGTDVKDIKKDVSAFREGMHLFQGSMEEAQSKSLAEARSAKRKRRLDQLEIPADHVTITDELLGKGGFGEVFLADYNGRNAAAKVLHISHDLARRGENAILDGSTAGQLKRKREETQRKAFLLELGTMIRLRSPYTVDVYGAVTSMQDRLVLVMELLAGGDLRTLLKNAEQALPEKQCRQIIGDICAGMAFLHTKKTVHGDLKSANVLLDGAGRAKIGDFGTSRWTQHTMSTGLATFTTKSSTNTQMSLAWSAPEVLDAEGSTYASDVYSFGVVVWEVISRELPWGSVTHPKDIYIRVVLKNMRPVIPDDAPGKLADVARSCWAGEAGERPTFTAILEGIKANGWNE